MARFKYQGLQREVQDALRRVAPERIITVPYAVSRILPAVLRGHAITERPQRAPDHPLIDSRRTRREHAMMARVKTRAPPPGPVDPGAVLLSCHQRKYLRSDPARVVRSIARRHCLMRKLGAPRLRQQVWPLAPRASLRDLSLRPERGPTFTWPWAAKIRSRSVHLPLARIPTTDHRFRAPSYLSTAIGSATDHSPAIAGAHDRFATKALASAANAAPVLSRGLEVSAQR
jgi:hypothetical protein